MNDRSNDSKRSTRHLKMRKMTGHPCGVCGEMVVGIPSDINRRLAVAKHGQIFCDQECRRKFMAQIMPKVLRAKKEEELECRIKGTPPLL